LAESRLFLSTDTLYANKSPFPTTFSQKRAAMVLLRAFGGVSALANKNVVKNEEILQNKGGLLTDGLLRPTSCCLKLIWVGVMKNG